MSDLESIMDEKTRMACACAQLNEAIHALEQATFNLGVCHTFEKRLRVWDLRDELKDMVDELIEYQKTLREEFRREEGSA